MILQIKIIERILQSFQINPTQNSTERQYKEKEIVLEEKVNRFNFMNAIFQEVFLELDLLHILS